MTDSERGEYASEYVAIFKSNNVEVLNAKATRAIMSKGPRININEDILERMRILIFFWIVYINFSKKFIWGLSTNTSGGLFWFVVSSFFGSVFFLKLLNNPII